MTLVKNSKIEIIDNFHMIFKSKSVFDLLKNEG